MVSWGGLLVDWRCWNGIKSLVFVCCKYNFSAIPLLVLAKDTAEGLQHMKTSVTCILELYQASGTEMCFPLRKDNCQCHLTHCSWWWFSSKAQRYNLQLRYGEGCTSKWMCLLVNFVHVFRCCSPLATGYFSKY